MVIHFNGSTQNIELLLRMVISVNQLCQLVRELWGNPKQQVNWIKWRLLHNFLLQKCKPMKSDKETCCKNTSNDLKFVRRPEVIQTMIQSKLEISRNWTNLRHQEEKEINLYAENIRCLEVNKELVSKGGSKEMHDLAESRT